MLKEILPCQKTKNLFSAIATTHWVKPERSVEPILLIADRGALRSTPEEPANFIFKTVQR